MPQKAKSILSSLLISATSPASYDAVRAPLSSLLISSSIPLHVSANYGTYTSSDSTDGSCTDTDAVENTSPRISEKEWLHVVPWEGDPSQKPAWWSYSYAQIFDYFRCTHILPGYATIYDEGEYILKVENYTLDPLQIQNLTSMWDEIHTKYKAEVNLSPKSSSKKVIVVPAEIGDAGSDKGRGVFVTERVPKGALVINTDSDTIGIFKDGHTWRKFVATLPAYTACNVIEWSWIQDFDLDDKEDIRNGLTIMTAWDESNLLNNADWEDSEEDPNVKCGTPPEGWPEKDDKGAEWGPCLFHYYAIKDLEPGEEILMAYGEFEDFHRDWPKIGMPVEYGLPEPIESDQQPSKLAQVIED